MVRQLFHPFDVEEICRIRIPMGDVEDCVARHHERSGMFTVKSAYRLADTIKRNGNELASSSGNDPGERTIWDVI